MKRRTFLEVATASTFAAATSVLVRAQNSIDDPLGVRPDFPAVQNMMFFDTAGTGLSPRQSLEVAQNFVASKGIDPIGPGELMAHTNEVRVTFARLVGAEKEEIGLLYATGEGEHIVTRALNLRAGDNVVIDDIHYETSFLLYQKLAEKLGIEVRTVRSVNGAAPVELYARHVDDRTRLISVAWVSNKNGYRHDLKGLASLAHGHGAYLYADAIQGVGMLDIDVKAADVDFLSSGTYKWLLAGYGVAPFYVRKELMDLVTPDRYGSFSIAKQLPNQRSELYTDARKFIHATLSFEAVYHLGASLEYILDVGVPNIERHTVGLANRLNEGLRRQGFDVWTPPGNKSAMVSFRHGRDTKFVRQSLQSAGIKVTVSENINYENYIRVAIALFNNESEIDQLLAVTGSWV